MFKNRCTQRDFTTLELLHWLLKNNPELIAPEEPQSYPSFLISTIPIKDLKLPNGWYINEKNEITNKGNSITGISHSISVTFQS